MPITRIDTHETHGCGGVILLHIEKGSGSCLVCDDCQAFIAVDAVLPAGQDAGQNKAAWDALNSRSPGPVDIPAA